MKSPGMFPKAAALVSFVVLLSAFIAYRAGVFEPQPDDTMSAALQADSTKRNSVSDAPPHDPLQELKTRTITAAPTRTPVPKIRLADSTGDLQSKAIITEDSVRRRKMELMSTSKSIQVFE